MADFKTTAQNVGNFAKQAMLDNLPIEADVIRRLYGLSKITPEQARKMPGVIGRGMTRVAESALSPIVDPAVAALRYINSESDPSQFSAPMAVASHPQPASTFNQPDRGTGYETVTSGQPKSPAAEVLYQNSSGEQIAPQSGRSGGGFTAPNNDPTTPGMTRQWTAEPTLEAFNPDDSRFAKRQLDIESQKTRVSKAERDRVQQLAEADRARQIANEAIDRQRAQEDRARQQAIQDRQLAWMADQQAREARAAEQAMEWSRANGGLAPTAENQKAVFENTVRNNNVNEFQGNWTRLAQIQSQIPLVIQAIQQGADLKQVDPDIADFIQRSAPDLDKMPKPERDKTLAAIEADLKSQIQDQKFIASKRLEQNNKQNFSRQGNTAAFQE